MYWRIGRDILERQAKDGWGSKVVDRIAHDLRVEFPQMKGFSSRNLQYMRAFAEAWPGGEIVQQAAAQLPWFRLCTLLDKLKTREERDWYLYKAIEHGGRAACSSSRSRQVHDSGWDAPARISTRGCHHRSLTSHARP